MEPCAIINIVALALILICATIGIVKGFSKSFISTFGTLIALIIAALLSLKTASTLEDLLGAISFFSEKVSGTLSGIFGEEIMNATVNDLSIGKINSIPSWIASIILNAANDGSINQTMTLSDVIAPIFGYYITVAISFIILFILFKIIIFLAERFISKITRIRIVGIFDRILGCILGLINGIIFVQFLIMLFSILPIGFAQNIALEIEKSSICSFLSSFNLFSAIFGKI